MTDQAGKEHQGDSLHARGAVPIK